MGRHDQDLKEEIHGRLLERCEVDARTDCWIYTRCWGTGEEGKISVGGQTYGVARVAAWLYKGRPKDLDGPEVVFHRRCRTPACFNPWHLSVAADRGEALAVMRRLGRWGNRSGGHKLSQRTAAQIRLQAGTMSLAQLQAAHSVGQWAIRACLKHETYRDLTADVHTFALGGGTVC